MIDDQKTVLMIKPEVIRRGMVGRVLEKLEDAGLEIYKIKEDKATKRKLEKHYVKNPEWIDRVGSRVCETLKRNNKLMKYFGTTNPTKIGSIIYRWNIQLVEGQKVILAVICGPHAIERVKQIVGATNPMEAARGTIRGDWCTDSVENSVSRGRAIQNLVHRSSNPIEVKREMGVWFS